jgi:hypothetical protein
MDCQLVVEAFQRPLAYDKDVGLRQQFPILPCPHDERFDEILSLFDGFSIRITIREIAWKFRNGDNANIVHMELLRRTSGHAWAK